MLINLYSKKIFKITRCFAVNIEGQINIVCPVDVYMKQAPTKLR